jgi:large subunit ribosomal protein L3
MQSALFTKKVGMISWFTNKKVLLPVTVLKVLSCMVIRKKTIDKDGYNAVIVNYGPKAKKLTKAIKNSFSHLDIEPKKYLRELKLSPEIYETTKVGDILSLEQFYKDQFIDAKGTSIGKGFAGGMKRHHFSGLEASHGVSASHRAHGSTGSCQDPGKVFKGKKMAGHLGAKTITQQNLQIVEVDKEKEVILVKGCVPGSKGSVLFIRNSIKK